MADLATIAPAFVEIAHRIVWCTAATASPDGEVQTRILHPFWQWDGEALTGWILTSPNSPKARHLADNPRVSLTYWDATHDTCSADCHTAWELSPEGRHAGWDRFLNAPAPVGYDPKIIPQWTDPDAPEFGVLRLDPTWLRVMPGTVMLHGKGDLLTWRARSRLVGPATGNERAMADTGDPTELREEVEEELDDLAEDAAEQERDRMAERDAQGVDEPNDQ